MSRKTYRYDKKTGSMIEVDRTQRSRSGPYIQGDIEPYRAMGPEHGRLITSRSEHRAYLKRHNLIEVGNERKYMAPPKD